MKCFLRRYLALLLLFFGTLSLSLSPAYAQDNAVIVDDPVAFIGHGALFDKDGKQITPDADFFEKTIDLYIASLRNRLNEADRKTFDENRSNLFKAGEFDKRSQILAKSRMAEWLLKRAGDARDGSIGGKLSLMNQLLQYENPALRDKKIELQPQLHQRLTEAGFGNIAFFSTQNLGAAYVAECAANGVPIPPSIGSSQWSKSVPGGDSTLPGSKLFIVSSIKAEVYVYESTAPEGMCIALPRSANPGSSGNKIQLDGVICLGKATSKACFWDNQEPDGPGGEGPAFEFEEGDVIPISQFAGGADLLGGSGGVCTGCHTGENPYIIHPDTPLGNPALSGYPLFPDQWYEPIVHPDWPQNAGPLPAASVPGACGGCHSLGGFAGAFPLLSQTLSGAYCSNVLANAINRTMPPSNPGSLSNDPAVQALQNLCNNVPAPMMRVEDTTIDFGDVELGFTFSKALIIHNDGDADLTVSVAVQGTPNTTIWTDIGIATNVTIIPGDPPMVLRQEFHPTALGAQSMQLRVTSNDAALASQTVTLSGNGISPKPLDSVLVLDRSGSMADQAGYVKKIDALRTASQLYANLLRFDALTNTGDKLGFVKYNDTNSEYMPLGLMDAARRSSIETNFLSAAAVTDPSRLQPSGTTGIGGAMQRAANMLLGIGNDRNIAMVLLTDGAENESPFIADVKDGIMSANSRLKIFSVGLGFAVEPAKLQSITNVTDGYHQVVDELSGRSVFDLETFYFKIFANAAGMNQVVDPTVLVDVSNLAPTVISRARIVTSDRSATFVVIDDPALRPFYDMEFISPKGVTIQPGTSIGGVPIQERRNLNHRIFRIIFPDVSLASEFTGDWILQLKPNGKWSRENVKGALGDSNTQYDSGAGNLNPYTGFVPIGFMAAVTTDYRLDVAVSATNYLPGDRVKIRANLSDRGWPAPNGKVKVVVTLADGSEKTISLRDDGQGDDPTASDAVWSGSFDDTDKAGNYRFLFRAVGHNLRGELAPREDTRFVTLKPLERTPIDPKDPRSGCVDACLKFCMQCRRQ